ncbi:MAG: hypothetical protein AAF485_04620 [Chloroflexota bacterium]
MNKSVLPNQLPPSYQAWLDPDQPLPQSLTFIPLEMKSWLGYAFILAFLSPFALGTGTTAPEAWWHRLQGIPTDPRSLWLDPIVFLITAPITVWAMWQLWQAWQQRRLYKAGRWRQGIFLGTDAVLFNDAQRCTVIPRERIVRLETSPPTLIYYDDTGQVEQIGLPTGRLQQKIANWLHPHDA